MDPNAGPPEFDPLEGMEADPADPLLSDGEALVGLLKWIAFGLLVLFVSGVVCSALPLRLLDPLWQLRLSQTLIDYSAIPLVAFGLVHLAAFLDPLDERLAARREALRHWAVLAVFGFLLLIPLQPWALWKGWSQASGSREAELRQARSQVEQLRQAIATAGSTAELQQRLARLRAPTVPEAQLARPLPELRQLMLERLDRFRGGIERRLSPPPPALALREQMLEAVRVAVASLGMALAWAAGAEWPNQDGTLLEHWAAAFQRRGRPGPPEPDQPGEGLPGAGLTGAGEHGAPRPRGRGIGRRAAVDEDFFERLAEEEESGESRPGQP